jgi:hypothetical protein
MEKLKRLALSVALMSVLAASAFAGETPAPPCAPGETQGPPCTSQSVTNDSTAPGEMPTPPASESLKLIDLAEQVVWSLLLF